MFVSTCHLRKPALALSAFAALALALSACAYYKPGSLALSQPGEIGPVRVHMSFCAAFDAEGKCVTASENEEGQTFIAIAVPQGTTAPDTIIALTEPPSEPGLVFRRNQSAAEALGQLKEELNKPTWPPLGSELIGYMSDLQPALEGENVEWTIDPEFGLPVPADGGPYGGGFLLALAVGQRLADPSSASAPASCPAPGEESTNRECDIIEEARTELRVTDLRVKAEGSAPTVGAGQEATLPFALEVGTTATAIPSFSLSATTNLSGAAVTVPDSSYKPSAPTSASRRTSASRSVKVKVPANAKAGTYSVTLTAKTAAGATVSQTNTFVVGGGMAPPSLPLGLKFGKLKLNKAKGTATLPVQVPGAGTLTASGKKIVKAVRKAKAPSTVKVTIKAKGKAKKALNKTGKATVKFALGFKPTSGPALSQPRTLTLKKTLKP